VQGAKAMSETIRHKQCERKKKEKKEGKSTSTIKKNNSLKTKLTLQAQLQAMDT